MFHICLCCLVRHRPFRSFLHSCISSGPSPPLHMRTRHLCGSSFLRQSHLRRKTSRIASIPFPFPLFSFVFDTGSRNVFISGIKELFLGDPFVHTKRSLPTGFVPYRRSWQEIPKHSLGFLPASPAAERHASLLRTSSTTTPRGVPQSSAVTPLSCTHHQVPIIRQQELIMSVLSSFHR